MTSAIEGRQLDDQNPWPGLESFKENAEAFFYGRDREAASLVSYVVDAPVAVLYGRSGLGKTSLLQAGVFPTLREKNFLPLYVRFKKPDKASFSSQLRQSVRDSIRDKVPDAMLPSDTETLWEYLHRNDFELWSDKNYPLTPVIVFDQFEELFIHGEREPDLVKEFMHDLGDLAENRIPANVAGRIETDQATADGFHLRSQNYKILISLREDFLPELEGWRRLIPALGRSRLRLLPLRTEEAFDAVRKPAGDRITDALARRVVGIVAGNDLLGESDSDGSDDLPRGDQGSLDVEPALLSLYCRELNEERKRLKLDDFNETLVEGKSDILLNYYADCIRDKPKAARFIESRLITEKGFRDDYPSQDAVPTHLTEEELTALIDARLLRREDRYGAERIELTHDVLTKVVAQHRDQRAADDALAEADVQRRHATARHLIATAKDMLAQTIPGGDVRAFQQLLVARKLVPALADEPIREALVARPGTLKIIDAGNLLTTVAFSPDGQRLASAGVDHMVRLWDADTGQAVGEPLTGHSSSVTCVAFSPDGQRLASASDDHSVRIWNARTGAPIGKPLTGHTGFVFAVAFSPDGRRLASAGADGTVRLWELRTRSTGLLGALTGHENPVLSVAFSPDGERLASASWDRTVRLWDPRDGQLLGEPLVGHRGIVRSVAFGPDGRRLASTGDDGTVRMWDARTGAPLGKLLGGDDDTDGDRTVPVWSVAFSPDGQRLATASADQTVRVWDAYTGESLGEPLTGHTAAVRSVAFSPPDGQRLASASRDGSVRIWDAFVRPHIGAPLNGPRVGNELPVWSVVFSPAGEHLASGGADGTVRIWDADTGQPIGAPLDSGAAKEVAFSPDGQRLTTAGSDGTVRVWDAGTGQPLSEPLDTSALAGVALSPDGQRLAGAEDDGTVRMSDTDTGLPIAEPLSGHTNSVKRIAFSPAQQLLASADDEGTVRFWDASNGAPCGEPFTATTGDVTRMQFSRDGKRLATASTDQTARIWDVQTCKPVGAPLTGHTGTVNCATFSRDGQRVATASRDGTVRVWDAHTGQPRGGPLTGHTGNVTDVAFSRYDQHLASAGDDGTVRMWPGEALPDMLCSKLSANMSERQWREWVSPDIDYIPACPNLPRPPDGDPLTHAWNERTEPWTLWEPCVAGQDASALEQLAGELPEYFGRSTLDRARWSRLSFYELHRLMELRFVRDHRPERAFLLVGPEGAAWLTGKSDPIHTTNENESLALTESTVVDYVRFFFYFLRGDEGAFVLLESADQIGSGKDADDDRVQDEERVLTLQAARAKARPLLMRGLDAEGRWLADATVAYDRQLFGASLAVTPNGLLEMTGDDPIGSLGDLVVQTPDLKWDPLAAADPEELSQSLAEAEQLATAHPDNLQYQRDWSINLDWIADARMAREEVAGALQAYQRSLAIAERLAAAHQNNPQYQHDLAVGLSLVGDAHLVREDAEEAGAAYTRALDIFQRLANAHPEDPQRQCDLALSLRDLGNAREASEDAEGALDALARSLQTFDELASVYPDNRDYERELSASWNRLGSAKMACGDADGALQAYEQALTTVERLVNTYPDNPQYQRDQAAAAYWMASALEEAGDSAATDLWRRAHEIFVELNSRDRLNDDDLEVIEYLSTKLDPAEGAS